MCNQTTRNEDASDDGVHSTKMGQRTAVHPSNTAVATTSNNNNETPKKYVNGHSKDGQKIFDSSRPELPKDKPLLIGIRGEWYDVTSYLPHHPGGDVLLDFAGQDATAQFLAYHDAKKVLKHRKPVGTYEFNEDAPGGDRMQGDWLKLYDKYEELGYNKTPASFILSRFAIIFGFLIVSLSCVRFYLQSPNSVVFFVGAICMSGFWQQSGFLMHDTMHTILFHNRKLDQAAGWFFGNVFMGISGKWWRDEHNEHHLFTNTVVEGFGCTDPQMMEDVWVQDMMLAPVLYAKLPKIAQVAVAKYQHLYFVPLLVFVGPYAIKLIALFRERRRFETLGQLLYFSWVATLMSVFPTWQEAIGFYCLAMTGLGVLSIQLLVSHYSKPWTEKERTKGCWAKRQVESVVDIMCPLWLDWFHGGLHLHSPHHLYPRMSRYHYRAVHDDIKQLCANNGVELDCKYWFDAVSASIEHLRCIGLELQAADKKLA